jgi:alkanesulfonate monooxygenase SsuD/methylene tetrahydromethanopterin reductase-like flavin-dependent oxidoreductase (luciferase family)
LPAFDAYRRSFAPSPQFPAPHTILGVAVVCADTQEEADFIATSMDLLWVNIHRGEFIPLPSPEDAARYPYSAAERRVVDERRALTVVGPPDVVAEKIDAMARACDASEVMVTSNIHSHAARLRSYELLSCAFAA